MIKKDGYDFAFDPAACESCGGKCCTGDSGYIWIYSDEIKSISSFLNLSVDDFLKNYCYEFDGKVSIKEKPFESGFACVFFDKDTKMCNIYDARPNQCRTFPFWQYFKNRKDELSAECAGVIFDI